MPLALLFARAPLHSQTTDAAATLDAAATRISYSDGAGITGLSLSPGVQLVRPWQALVASGSWTRFDGGVWSVQGQLDGSAYLPALGAVRPEVEGRATGTRHQDGGSTGDLGATLRLHLLRDPWGVWIGGGGGRAWNGLAWRTTLEGEGGAWMRLGPGVATLTVSASGIGSDLGYGEAETAYRVTRGALELVAYGGVRHWLEPADASGAGWGGASLAWWFGDRFAVTASGGAYPTDYAQGLPDGRFGSIGLRVATGRVEPARRANEPLDLLIPPAPPRSAPALEIRRAGESAIFTLRGVRGTRIELMGDFTGWEPIALTAAGDRWTVRLPVAAGVYRVNLRVDGAAWSAPPGLTSVTDEFGGAAGVFVIE